jgi:histidinol-phosphate phosphatase family protein
MIKLLMLDLDGTVRNCTVEGQPTPNKPGEQALIPLALGRMNEAQLAGVRIVFITNAGGVGEGYQTMDEWRSVMVELFKMLTYNAIDVADITTLAAFGKPGKDARRKPSPAMLNEALTFFDVDPGDALMVGDRPEDAAAASAAGVPFMWAAAWHGSSIDFGG